MTSARGVEAAHGLARGRRRAQDARATVANPYLRGGSNGALVD